MEQRSETNHYNVSGKHPQVRNFCIHCGSTLYWTAESMRGLTGVAGGAFVETQLPEPVLLKRTGSSCCLNERPENLIRQQKLTR